VGIGGGSERKEEGKGKERLKGTAIEMGIARIGTGGGKEYDY
jgi:hypothetical protein